MPTPQARHRTCDQKFRPLVLGFPASALALRLGLDRSAVYHWLRRTCPPHVSTALKIQKLAKRRGVVLSLDDFFAREGGPCLGTPTSPER